MPDPSASFEIPRLPATFKSRYRELAFAAALVCCVLFGVVFVVIGAPVFGGVFIVLGSVGAAASLLGTRRRSYSLTLDERGFEFSGLFEVQFVSWPDVAAFELDPMSAGVLWRPSESFLARGAPAARTPARMLPSTFGMTPERLLLLLDRVRAAMLAAPAAEPRV